MLTAPCFSWSFNCYDKTPRPKTIWGGKGLSGLHILIIVHQRGKSEKELKAGTWKNWSRSHEETMLTSVPQGLFSLLSLINEDHLPSVTVRKKLGPPI